jgi:hypothetical protein
MAWQRHRQKSGKAEIPHVVRAELPAGQVPASRRLSAILSKSLTISPCYRGNRRMGAMRSNPYLPEALALMLHCTMSHKGEIR